MNMNAELVSIIVPVYNSAKYVSRCLDSILKQTYTNYEIIIVDDGSTDNSKKICSNYVEKDSRIRYIYQNNKGVSSARNVGLNKCRGEYVLFVDSDDTICDTMIEDMYVFLKKNKGKILITSGSTILEDGTKCRFGTRINKENTIFTNVDMIKHLLQYACSSVWGILYEKSVIEHIRFDETLSNKEDMLFNIQAFLEVNEIYWFNRDHYYYHQHSNGLSQPSYKSTMMYLQVLSSLKELLPEKYDKEIKSFEVVSNYLIASRLCLNKSYNLEFKTAKNYLKENIKAIRKREIVLNEPVRQRSVLLVYFPTLFKIIKHYR